MSECYRGFFSTMGSVTAEATFDVRLRADGSVTLRYQTGDGDLAVTLTQEAFVRLRIALDDVEEYIQHELVTGDELGISLKTIEEANTARHERHIDALP